MLAGKTILVTGAAHGIGAATARTLAAAGARIIALDREPVACASESREVDIGVPDSIDAAVRDLPPLDGLANIAGVPGTAPAATVARVNYLGLRHLTERVAPVLRPGAAIVNIASTAGNRWADRLEAHAALAGTATFAGGLAWLERHPPQGTETYAWYKEALIVWTMLRAPAFARERRLRMNCVSPGATATRILEDFRVTLGPERVAAGIEWAGRAGRPEDIAPVIAFLMSEAAGWICGSNLVVDGGVTAWRFSEGASIGPAAR